jgi:hypothetical protein
MTTTKAISGNPKRNNGGTIVKAGNHDGTNITNSVTLASNASDKLLYGSQVIQAVSPDSSGNIGTHKPRTGDFAGQVAGNYIGLGYNTFTVANNLTISKATGGDKGARRPIQIWPGYQRLDITSWDYVTGAKTVGSNDGVTVQPSGINGTVGDGADDAANPTDAVPGELVYLTTGKLATQKDYEARTNP